MELSISQQVTVVLEQLRESSADVIHNLLPQFTIKQIRSTLSRLCSRGYLVGRYSFSNNRTVYRLRGGDEPPKVKTGKYLTKNAKHCESDGVRIEKPGYLAFIKDRNRKIGVLQSAVNKKMFSGVHEDIMIGLISDLKRG